MGSTESTQSSQTSSQQNTKKKTPYFTWKESEGGNVTLIHKTRVKLGNERFCTLPAIAVTNQSISKSDHELFEWKITIHRALFTHNPYTPDMKCYIGFMDAEPESNLYCQLLSKKGCENAHYFSVIYSLPRFVKDQEVKNDIFTFNVDFSCKTVTLSCINGVKPTKKLFPDIETQWTFKGNAIYPAVSKDVGLVEFTIHTKFDPKDSEITRVESQQSKKSLAVRNRMYDLEEKEGFGNQLDYDHDVTDRKTLVIGQLYGINSPNSIIWNIPQGGQNYRIDWGSRGSFCGLGIGRRRFIKPNTGGKYKVEFHFGFMFNGNDYKLTDVDFNSEWDDKHWMVLHRVTRTNVIELCGSVTAACNSLSEVWQKDGELDLQNDYKYYRLNPEFCRKSAKLIGDAINKERSRKYEFNKLHGKWHTITDLNEYTNCMLFVIRMCKVCGMDVPLWKEIIALFSVWEDSDKYAPEWNHFRKYAKP